MILGLTTSTFTLLHVLISLVGIGSGLAVMYGLLTANRLNRWTMLFLVSTALTSITGFLFPNDHVTPGIVVGVLSLIVLAVAVVGRYALRLNGAWRSIYVISASIALYFNVFVLVVQSFEKCRFCECSHPRKRNHHLVSRSWWCWRHLRSRADLPLNVSIQTPDPAAREPPPPRASRSKLPDPRQNHEQDPKTRYVSEGKGLSVLILIF